MTQPSRKVRWTFALLKALQKVGIAPDNAKAMRMPVAKRLAMGPGARMVGDVPDVPTRDLEVTTRDGASIKVRVYEPAGATAPVLYAHGGGFVVGGLLSCDHMCKRIAVEAGVVVVSVEYRLAPEHRFPGPLDDVDDALAWLLEQPWEHDRLVVAGDSAGGNLAAAIALRMRDRGQALAGQLLIYPILDLTISGEGVLAYRGIGLHADEGRMIADAYLGDGDPTDPYASPLLADDLSGLAPALVVTVEHDALRAEGAAYAERLREAGVPTAYLDVDGHVHASLSIPAMYDGIDDIYAVMVPFVRDPQAATRQPV